MREIVEDNGISCACGRGIFFKKGKGCAKTTKSAYAAMKRKFKHRVGRHQRLVDT